MKVEKVVSQPLSRVRQVLDGHHRVLRIQSSAGEGLIAAEKSQFRVTVNQQNFVRRIVWLENDTDREAIHSQQL